MSVCSAAPPGSADAFGLTSGTGLALSSTVGVDVTANLLVHGARSVLQATQGASRSPDGLPGRRRGQPQEPRGPRAQGNGTQVGELDMAGLNAVMAGYWDEDESGVPWRVLLYVDARADEARRSALADVFLGRAGGTPTRNYTPAITRVFGVRPADIEVVHERGRQRIRVGDPVEVAARTLFPSEESVSCGI